MATEAGLPSSALGELGSGAEGDKLSFRLVLGVLWRCVPLLRDVRWHILAFTGIVLVLLALGLAVGAVALDLFWTRVLQGEPLTELQASLLRYDPALTVHVDALTRELRQAVRNRIAIDGAIVIVVLSPMIAGLVYYMIWILQRINQVLREQLMARIQTLSLRFHADSRVGDSVYRLFQDSAMVTDLVRLLFLEPLFQLVRFASGIVVVAVFDPLLAGILLLIWPPGLLLGMWFSQRLRVRFRRAREANSALTSRIVESLAGIKVIKAFGAEERQQRIFEDASRQAFDAAFEARALYATFQIAVFWLAGSSLLVVTAWGSLLTREGGEVFGLRVAALLGFTVWNLGLFNFFKERAGDASTAMEGTFGLWGRVQDVAIGLDRVFELLDLQPEVEDAPDACPMAPFRSRIEFRGLDFAYQPDRPVLRQVDLRADAGTITAIVGPTGSGKSSLMALLLRLFDPDAGTIEIDGVDLRRMTLASLRANISIALQENWLFGATVRENIRYAVPHASDAQVREVARIACADEFIAELPEGYDTMLGERGTKLSTGQRQRISIARALLKDAPILILDEPTASLDADTELRLMRNLEVWGEGRAVFLITHRLSTVRCAHRIAVMREGRLAEFGAHEELMEREDGHYRRLVETEAA